MIRSYLDSSYLMIRALAMDNQTRKFPEVEGEVIAQNEPKIDLAGGTAGGVKPLEDIESASGFIKDLNIQENDPQARPAEPGFVTELPTKQNLESIVPGHLPTQQQVSAPDWSTVQVQPNKEGEQEGQDPVDDRSDQSYSVYQSSDQDIDYDELPKEQTVSGYIQVDDGKIRKVEAGNFPPFEELSNEAGLVIYDSLETNGKAGKAFKLPQEFGDLGSGSFGDVFASKWHGEPCAVKWTQYRQEELNIWSTLDHPNVIRLLGVMFPPSDSGYCYQFMPLMTGDLTRIMSVYGSLLRLIGNVKNRRQWSIVLDNVLYVFEEILKGLMYLEKMNVQHSDIKGQNIVILKTCNCEPDIFHCECFIRNKKYQVAICDFDAAKQTEGRRYAHWNINSMDWRSTKSNVRGTPGYRAPEMWKLCPELKEFEKRLKDGTLSYDMEGPWSDMWSFGVMLLTMVMGSYSEQDYATEAQIAACFNPEANAALCRLTKLLQIALEDPDTFKPFAKVAIECLNVDPKKRQEAADNGRSVLGKAQLNLAKHIT